MDTLVQQTVNGLMLGSIYALIALGYTMVYGILRCPPSVCYNIISRRYHLTSRCCWRR